MEERPDLISRQAAIDVARKCPVKEVTPAYMLIDKAEVMTELMMLPSEQSELEDKIRAIGYTGKEGRIYIGGRLFAVRELPQ